MYFHMAVLGKSFALRFSEGTESQDTMRILCLPLGQLVTLGPRTQLKDLAIWGGELAWELAMNTQVARSA